jgi:AraC-like DNA-binding protein
LNYSSRKYYFEAEDKMASNTLTVRTLLPIKAQNAGLFISRGSNAMHPTRIISSHELILVKQGELDMWEEECQFHLEAGQTLHLFPGRRHGSSKPLAADLKFYWIHFEVNEPVSKQSRRKDADFSPAIVLPQVATLAQPERLERLFRLFLDEQETGLLHPDSANLLTMLMLSEVTHYVETPVDTNDLNAVATWAHTYIRINFERPITSSSVAAALGYNVDYLGRIYHRTYHCTLTEAIHRRRISKACDYLIDGNLTISQIAPKCGFTDPDYFRRIFKRYMKITPGEYRDENSRIHVNTH